MNECKNWGKIAGLVLHTLIVGLMVFTGSEKVLGMVPPEALAKYGLGEQVRLLGAVALLTALLLLILRTSSLGILLTSSIWGGAICIHMAYSTTPVSTWSPPAGWNESGIEHLTMPVYCRAVAELLAALEREDSPVRGAFAVDRVEELEVPTPFSVAFRRDGDVAAYAGAYTGFLGAVSEPVVLAALNQSVGEAVAVESLYECVRARLLAEPERYLFRTSWRPPC
jgi:hypothetical protein